MQKDIETLAGRECTLFTSENPGFLLVQPADGYDLEGLDREVSLIESSASDPFALCAFRVTDWNTELSPWDAPPVFGNESFGHGAPETLKWIENCLISALVSGWKLPAEIPVVLGGYSLAGFFALWSAYETSRFSAAACASPSVWFPGWTEYAEKHTIRTNKVYLSLGNREEKTRNPVMARVGECIRRQHQLLNRPEQSIKCTLEWNEGNHFREPDARTARAFAWCLGN